MMRYLHFTLLGALLLAFSCAPKQTLFEDGRSEYSIVVGENATLIEQYAAQELQTWIRPRENVVVRLCSIECCLETDWVLE